MIQVGLKAGVAAFVSCVIAVPVVRALCRRWAIVDPPGPLKIHARPTSRLGGVAIALALFTAVMLFSAASVPHHWAFFSAFALIWLAGFTDDLRDLSPVFRLAAQFGAAVILWSGGWRVAVDTSGAFGFAAMALWIPAFVNSFNFLDGSDGVLACSAAVMAAAYLLTPGALAGAFSHLLACVLLGASVGFLLYNFPAARIFMGDSGSTTLGFGIAFLGFRSLRSRPATVPMMLFPLFVAALPLLDALLAVIRRTRRGASPLQGDRLHSYDLLLARGWSSRRVALVCCGVTAGMSAMANIAARSSRGDFLWIPAAGVGALLFVSIRLGALRSEPVNSQGPNAASLKPRGNQTAGLA